MTTFLLIRHGSHDLLGRALAGRACGVQLNACGRAEAEQLAERLALEPIAAIYTSPRARARETAAPMAKKLVLTPRVNAFIDEIDFGLWTGRTFVELQNDPGWPLWVHRRSVARAPQGEAFADVQRRIVDGVSVLGAEHPNDLIALFTHGDVIKAALAHFLHIPLDELERFDIAPASISVIVTAAQWAQVRLVNGGAALRIG